jgi:hypothetical protein
MPNRCGLPISFFDQVDKRLDNVEGRLDTLDVGQSYLKDQINGLEAAYQTLQAVKNSKSSNPKLISIIRPTTSQSID